MTTSTLAFGKANASGILRQAVAKQAVVARQTPLSAPKCSYSSSPAPAPKPSGNVHDDSSEQRELFMNILTANATKRDAKQYLARFKQDKPKAAEDRTLPPLLEERNARNRRDQDRLDRTGVNLGGLYAPARAIADAPQFTQPGVEQKEESRLQQEPLHVALVCLRAMETLDDATIEGVSLTLTQLVKLDMRIAVVLDCNSGHGDTQFNPMKALELVRKQAERLSNAIARHSNQGARFVCEVLETQAEKPVYGKDHSGVRVALPKLLLEPLQRSMIPIIPTMGYTSNMALTHVSTTSAMTALSKLLSGLPSSRMYDESAEPRIKTSLDRIIVLDTVGGIPSKARSDGSHVFINLEQEYDDIETELAQYVGDTWRDRPSSVNVYAQHHHNLRMARACLSILPAASSALIITPQEAANSSLASPDSPIGAGTRRQKNTLIHNLLTNKPIISSSLPMSRLPHASTATPTTTMPTSTVLKRGMPVTIMPQPAPGTGWLSPESGHTSLDLENDPRVDLPRLVHLIEDSFRRKLDVQNYLSRIRGRIAGLIIAGEYEGGAILTWESPPSQTATDPTHLVPYLDKFAVLGSSQGSSGVADIVFQAMVRTCFPLGVCWRSRQSNPVNKWYFERADGTWKIPHSNWTMFWTGEGVVEGTERWGEYVGVCRGIEGSWADGTTKSGR